MNGLQAADLHIVKVGAFCGTGNVYSETHVTLTGQGIQNCLMKGYNYQKQNPLLHLKMTSVLFTPSFLQYNINLRYIHSHTHD